MKAEIEQFIDSLLSKSSRTKEIYQHNLEEFAKFVSDIPLSNLLPSHVIEFHKLLINKGYKDSSRYSFIAAIRNFLRWCSQQGIAPFDYNLIEYPQIEDKEIVTLTPDEIDKIIFAASSVRDKAIISFLATSGIRVGELISLKWENIDLENCKFSVLGKGNKRRVGYFGIHTQKYLKELRAAYKYKNRSENDPVFTSNSPNHKGEKLTKRSVERLVKSTAVRAGIKKKVYPHILRHSFATNLLNNGCDIRIVQQLMGHSSILTTQKYTHISDPQLMKAFKEYSIKTKDFILEGKYLGVPRIRLTLTLKKNT